MLRDLTFPYTHTSKPILQHMQLFVIIWLHQYGLFASSIPHGRHCIAYQNFSSFPCIEFRLFRIKRRTLWSCFQL